MSDNIWDLSKPRVTVHPDDAIADIRAYANSIPGQNTTDDREVEDVSIEEVVSGPAEYSQWNERNF